MNRLLVPVLVVLCLGAGAAESAAPYVLQINMYGDQEVPPIDSPAWGFVRFFFNEDRTESDYTVDLKGYSSTAVAGADIHRGAPGETGPVVFHLADGHFIVTAGHLTMTPEEVEEFASGNWYVSLKTVFHPEGEIRGQIVVPADFLPGAPAPAQSPATPAPSPPANNPPPAASGGVISPPNTGSAGLR